MRTAFSSHLAQGAAIHLNHLPDLAIFRISGVAKKSGEALTPFFFGYPFPRFKTSCTSTAPMVTYGNYTPHRGAIYPRRVGGSMQDRRNKPQQAYSRQDRLKQVMDYLFYCHQTGIPPSSYMVACALKLSPSQYVRGMLAELEHEGVISKTEVEKPNGRISHLWRLEVDDMAENRSHWLEYLVDRFGVWPDKLRPTVYPDTPPETSL